MAVAHRRRGVLLEMSNERAAALHEYEQGVHRQPSDADLWYNLGYIYLTGADNEMALRCFTTCSRLNASHPLGQEGRGTALFALGHLRAAVHRFRIAVPLSPTRPQAHLNLAAALGKLAMDRDSSFLRPAVEAYERVRRLLPDSADAVAKMSMLKVFLAYAGVHARLSACQCELCVCVCVCVCMYICIHTYTRTRTHTHNEYGRRSYAIGAR